MSQNPLKHTTIALARAWNTWDGERPAEMVFLPLGLRVTPMAYAASTKRATFFKPGEGLRFGARAVDASQVEMQLAHAGTELDFVWQKIGPFDLTGRWQTKKLGEWGLRFWMVMALSSEDGVAWTYDRATETLSTNFGHRHVAVKSSQGPLIVTAHASLAGLAAEYEEHGYWHLASRATAGTVMAFRYHLEEMPELTIAVAIRDDATAARQRAAAILAVSAVQRATPLPWREVQGEGSIEPPSDAQNALAAIRDVMGWNTVFDRINRRSYISLSRNWNQEKFGGFGVWLNDQQYSTYLVDMLDTEQAHENLNVVIAGQTPDRNLPCLLTAKDAWVDRSQLPIGSFLSWLMFLRNGSRPMLELAYATLLDNHDWWVRHRDGNKTGLVSFGNSPVGTGLYRGTNIGARDESSMDNSPMHDGARVDNATGTLNQWDVGLNSMLALDAEMLAQMARELGQTMAADRLEAEAATLKTRIQTEFWDEARGIFANKLWTGKFARSVTPTSFWPLLCGAASEAQAKRLLHHLDDPKSFGGAWGLPSVSRDDPAFKDNVYWRGRIWPPLNWTVWQGLKRYGFDAAATKLAAKSWALFSRAWDKDRHCAENYNADTGEVLDQPDTDGFYSWGALMPALALAEVMDVSAWTGWTLRNDGKDLAFGPVNTPIGSAHFAINDGVMTLSQHGNRVLSAALRGQLTNLRIHPGMLTAQVPPGLQAGAGITLYVRGQPRLVAARQAGRDIPAAATENCLRLTLAATGVQPEPLMVVFETA